MFWGRAGGGVDVGGCIEPATQAYERSFTHGTGEASIGFAAVQSLGAAEDAAVCFDDLSKVLGHGATLEVEPAPAEPPFTKSVDNFSKLYLGSSRCTWHAPHVQREHPTLRGMLTGSWAVGDAEDDLRFLIIVEAASVDD